LGFTAETSRRLRRHYGTVAVTTSLHIDATIQTRLQSSIGATLDTPAGPRFVAKSNRKTVIPPAHMTVPEVRARVAPRQELAAKESAWRARSGPSRRPPPKRSFSDACAFGRSLQQWTQSKIASGRQVSGWREGRLLERTFPRNSAPSFGEILEKRAMRRSDALVSL
jgi:hypothetical protein